MDLQEIYNDSLNAIKVISGPLHETPLDFSSTYSRMTGAKVYLKLENLQKTGSFKVRGAYYKIWSLKDNEKKGVVAASAGNHAQGVAFAASKQGIPSIIVMPETAPISKVEATKNYGAEVVLHGRVYDDALSKALEIAEEKGYTFIHPFDDPKIIAGQGTILLEAAKQLGGKPDTVIVPIGGGGLASGIIAVARSLWGNSVRVIGVEPSYAAKFTESIRKGHPVTVPARPGIMDGLVVKKPGNITFNIISRHIDGIVTVDDKEVSQAIYLLLERNKTLAEGAGAAPLAALLSGKISVRENEKVLLVVSGGNIDPSRLVRVINYQLGRRHRIIRLEGLIPDEPGSLNTVLEIFAKARLNIIDIRHDRVSPVLEPGWAKIEVFAETPSEEAVRKVLEKLSGEGFPFRILKF
ncbi:MAG: threonine ammonia-lyase [Desulfurococcales archaeon]|nr:threonine ammonia-lyase [Desulfurococcales archaeon]